MSPIRKLLAAAVCVSIITSSIAFAQNAPPSTTEKVKTITQREWNRMKVQWAKEKEKWASCNKLSKDQKLKRSKSWSFIASCMTS